MSEQPQTEPTWVGEAPGFYTNALKVTGGPFDVMLLFGLLQPGSGGPAAPMTEITEVARISMSWGHLKSMIPMLARLVAEYESKVGQVPSPGFDDLWKG